MWVGARPRPRHFHGVTFAQALLVASARLTGLASFRMSGGGTPLPTEGRLSGRIGHDQCSSRRAASRSALLLRPLCQAPRLEPLSPHRRRSRPLAPIEDRQGEAQARHRAHPRGARSPGRLPDRHRPGLRYRCGRDGAVVDAGRTAGHHARLGIVRRRLGERCQQGAQAQERDRAQGRFPISPRSIRRPTWCSPGTAPPRECGCRTPIGSPPIAPA